MGKRPAAQINLFCSVFKQIRQSKCCCFPTSNHKNIFAANANGTVQLTVGVTTVDGRPLTEPVEVPLTVNPAWENWTTLLLVIGMGLLVVVGVIRARRTGASTRAPAVQGPEDPVELSRTGLSRLAPPDPGPHEPAQQNRRTQTDPQEERA